MAMKFFLLWAVGILAAAFFSFFRAEGFSKETVIVFTISIVFTIAAIGVFVIKNRRILDEVTKEPSTRNIELFYQLLKRRKTGDKA
jgi:hypothetical protein